MIITNIFIAIAKCFEIYMYMILVRCLLTWIPIVDWNNPIVNAFRASVDIYLDLFRKFIPPVGMFDISPIVAMFVLYFIRGVILYGFIFLVARFGMVG
jgi:YggT family protein